MYMLNVTLGQRAGFQPAYDSIRYSEDEGISRGMCFDCQLTFSTQFRVKLLVIQKSERPVTYRSVLQLSVHLTGRQALFFI